MEWIPLNNIVELSRQQ